MADPNIALNEGYQAFFNFTTGFESTANITSTTFEDLSFVGYKYSVFYADGSHVEFLLGDKNGPSNQNPASFDNVEHYHFSTDASGHRILDSGGSVSFKLFGQGASALVDSSATDLGSVSVFGDNFLSTWLDGNNSIAPAEFGAVTSAQELHGFGGRDNLIGGAGNDKIFLDTAGMTIMAGGPSGGGVTGNDTFILPAHVITPPDSQRSITIVGTDANFFAVPKAGEVNTIEARGDNDFSFANVAWINRIVYNGADTLDFGTGNFFSNDHIAPNTKIVGDAGADSLRVWINPAEISPGHLSIRGGGSIDLSKLRFDNWQANDKVIIMGDTANLAGENHILTPNVDTKVTGSLVTDNVTGGTGDDIISGGGRADFIDGGGGDDKISGGVDNDSVTGGLGDDVLSGGAGLDRMTGGMGADTLNGNGDGDVFVYLKTSESGLGDEHHDTIVRFQHGVDKIDVSAIDAIAATGDVDDAFSYIGKAAFTAAGQMRAEQHGGNLLVEFNTVGKGDAEMEILLSHMSLKDLAETDFTL